MSYSELGSLLASLGEANRGTAATRERSLRSVMTLLSSDSIRAELSAGRHATRTIEDGGAGLVDWGWVLDQCRGPLQHALMPETTAGGGGAAKGATRGLLVASLTLDVFTAALRGAHDSAAPENRGRARLLPHVAFALRVCAWGRGGAFGRARESLCTQRHPRDSPCSLFRPLARPPARPPPPRRPLQAAPFSRFRRCASSAARTFSRFCAARCCSRCCSAHQRRKTSMK